MRLSDQPMRSPPEYHKWVENERGVMQTPYRPPIAAASQTDGSPGLGFYATNRPHMFVMAMVRTLDGRQKGGALYPEGRTCVPGDTCTSTPG